MLSCDGAAGSLCLCRPQLRNLSRRGMLGGLAAGLVGAGRAAQAQTGRLTPKDFDLVPALRPAERSAVDQVRRIDVHHHPVPPDYAQAVAAGSGLPGPLRGWSPEKSLADMDRAGVATAMLSIPAAGLWFSDPAANRSLARKCNDYMAEMVQRYPGRFGFWAALPLPDVDGCLQELAYVIDTLRADGVGLFTSYGRSWLGDAAFAPLFHELNRRTTAVFVHPTIATCCGNLIPGIPEATIEYGTETARTIASLLFSGSARHHPDVKLIFSHAGGTMPALVERFVLLSQQPSFADAAPEGVLPLLARFYYDVAQAANPEALGVLMRVVPTSQVVFGTDYPYRTSIEHVAGLAGCGLSAEQLVAIGRSNALPLVPRLRS